MKSVRLSDYFSPERYEIMIRPNLEDFTFSGEETFSFKLSKPASEITLHASELEIDEACLKLGKKTVQPGKIIFNEKAETVIFKFPMEIPVGKGQLVLKFRGILNDKLRGFYRSRYVIDETEHFLATTQFESTDARRAFPCVDEPNKKAIFDITLMVPAKSVAISNTLPTGIVEHESGYQIVKFSPTPKMSTYLLAFIVGDFEWIEGKTKNDVLVRVFTTPGKKKQAKFALDVSIKCLEFYEDYFGIKYPLPSMDLIAIPDFSAGAMENWGAVTYRESALLIDEANSSAANRQRVAIVIAHELAHQWFGNLVTMEWWTHLWLNEGFASYMEYLAVDKLFPEWDIWTQFVFSDMGSALSLDGLKNTHPIEVEVHDPEEIAEIFDAVSYSKGASIIRMLAEYLGFNDFREGLRVYLKKFSYSNAKTEDLWLAFEKVSGKPVRKIMSNWTGKPGYPVISLKGKVKPFVYAQGKSAKLELAQERFFSSPISKKESRDKTIWSIPLKSNGDDSSFLMYKSRGAKLIHLRGEQTWIKLNMGEASFIRVKYPPEMLELLTESIEKKELGATDRLGLIRDAFALAEAGDLSSFDALNLLSSYKLEDDFTVWAEIASGIHRLGNLIAFEKSYPQFEVFNKQLFSEIALSLGWKKKPKEKHTDTLLRTIALYNYGSFGDKETINHAKELFNALISGKELDPDLRNVVYNLAAENGGETEFNQFLDLHQKTNLQHEKDRLARAMGLFKDKSLLKKTLDFAISEDVRSQDSIYIILALWSTNPIGRKLAWEFVKEHWPLLKERYSGGHSLSILLSGAGHFTNTNDAKDVEVFFKKNPTPEAARTITQSLEKINSSAAWLSRDKNKIAKFLRKY